MKRRANAQHRGLCCGSPGDGSQKCNLIPTGLVRMTKDRANTPRSKPRSLLMTPPCTEKTRIARERSPGSVRHGLFCTSRNVLRGMKCWSKILPALKHTRLTLMTFVYSPLAFSCKTRATTQKNINRFQSVMNTAIRYVCNTRLSRMRDQGINHHDLGAKLGIPPISAAIAQEQMRWLGHIDTYSKTFGRGIP